jgi:hypothetical protein
MSKIYLAPAVITTDESGAESRDPGTSDNGEMAPHTCGGMSAPHFDSDENLFVIVVNDDFSAPGDWVQHTKEEINSLYPGTFEGEQ